MTNNNTSISHVYWFYNVLTHFYSCGGLVVFHSSGSGSFFLSICQLDFTKSRYATKNLIVFQSRLWAWAFRPAAGSAVLPAIGLAILFGCFFHSLDAAILYGSFTIAGATDSCWLITIYHYGFLFLVLRTAYINVCGPLKHWDKLFLSLRLAYNLS